MITYSVTTEEVGLDRALARLWDPVLPPGWDAGRKFRWYYRANPNGPGKVLLLTCERDRGRRDVVGCAGFGARMMVVDGQSHRAALLADLGVEKEHRTVMPALKLTRAVQSHCRREYAFSYGFPNGHSIGVFNRIGYREVGRLTRYALVLRHAPYLRNKIKLPLATPLANVAGWMVDAPYRATRLITALKGARAQLEWVTHADMRFDALWVRAKERFSIIEYRGADYLRWRYFEHPSRMFEIAVLREGTRISAYVVIERVDGTANIWDVLGESDDAVRALMDRLATEMRSRGVFALSIHCVGSRLGDLLLSCGFRARESDKSLVIDTGDDLSPAKRTLLLDPASWYIADGGEDS